MKRRIFALLSSLCLLAGAGSVNAATYYISPDGNDSTNNGTAAATPWKTLSKVNGTTFAAGDKILFKSGEFFTAPANSDALTINGAGTSDSNRIVYGVYGGTDRAVISQPTTGKNGVKFAAANDWVTVQDLEIAGPYAWSATATDGAMTPYGIHLQGSSSNVLQGTNIQRVVVHNFMGSGIRSNYGEKLSDTRIEYCEVYQVGDAGIRMGNDGETQNGEFRNNLYVGHCYVHHTSGFDAGTGTHNGDGIQIACARNVTVEYCVVHNTATAFKGNSGGPVGIWFADVHTGLMQFNEVYNSSCGLSSSDGGGIDIDGGCLDVIAQYNYTHDNDASGYLLAHWGTSCSPTERNTFRYNLSINDCKKLQAGFLIWSGGGTETCQSTRFHNNLIVQTRIAKTSACLESGNVANATNPVQIYNNIFIATNGHRLTNVASKPNVLIRNNIWWALDGNFLYYSSTSAPSTLAVVDPSGLQVDPLIIDADALLSPPTIGITKIDQMRNILAPHFKLVSGSPAINAGLDKDLQGNTISVGTRDFYGNAIPQGGAYDIGSHERAPDAAGKIGFSQGYASGLEGTSVIVTVSRKGGSTGAATATVTSLDGQAKAGSDFTAVNTTLSWSSGDSADKSITIPLSNDSIVEGDENFSLLLSNVTGAEMDGDGISSITIQDNDFAPAANYANPLDIYGSDPFVTPGGDGKFYMFITDGDGTTTAPSRLESTDLVSWSNKQAAYSDLTAQSPHVIFDPVGSLWWYFGNNETASGYSIDGPFTKVSDNWGAGPWHYVDPAGGQAYMFSGGTNGGRHKIDLIDSPAYATQTIYPHFIDGWWGSSWEGTTIVKNGSTYYWFMSMNTSGRSTYRLAYATAPSPEGPWTMQTQEDSAAILRQSDLENIWGPGSSSIYTDVRGTKWLYYQQKDASSSTSVLTDRHIAMDPIWFDGSGVPHIRPTRATSRLGPNSLPSDIWPTVPATSAIEAESYAGSTIVTLSAGGTGTIVGTVRSQAYLAYRNVDFGAGQSGIQVNLSSGLADTGNIGSIEIHVDGVNGPLVGLLPVTKTAGWTTFQTFSGGLNQTVSGVKDVFLVFHGIRPGTELMRLDWFKFTASGTPNTNRPPVANPDSAICRMGTQPITFNVLSNDSDPDAGNTMSLVAASNATMANRSFKASANNLVVSANGDVAYTPPSATFWGEDVFFYTVKDSAGAYRTGTAKVKIYPGTNLHQESGGLLVIEAEDFNDSQLNNDTNGAWIVDTSVEGFKGTGYVTTADNGTSTTNSTAYLDYALDIRTPGVYTVWARCSQPDTNGNLSQISFTTTPASSLPDRIASNFDASSAQAGWYWVKLPELRSLRPGILRMRLNRYDDGHRIDQFVLSSDPDYNPANTAGTLTLSAASATVSEGAGSISISVSRTGGSTGAASVAYATANGTAIAGLDYTAKSGTLNWADGDADSKTIAIPILEDSLAEGNESFALTLSGATGAILGSPASATVTITDNEAPPTIYVYLLGGQSNAVGYGSNKSALPTSPVNLQQPQNDVLYLANTSGLTTLTTLRPASTEFGPEITFGRSMADYMAPSGIIVAIIKHAENGTNLYSQWAAGGTSGTSGDGTSYVNFQTTVSNGLLALHTAYPSANIAVKGMYWMQGESDASAVVASQYESNLTNFISDIRLTYGANLPFVIGRLSSGQTSLTATYLSQVRAAQTNIDTADPYAITISTDGYSLNADALHFTSASLQTLGYDFANAMKTLSPAPSGSSLYLSSASATVAENAGSVTITVSRNGTASGAASVQYASSNGTATAGSDYTTASGTLNWADGDSTSKTFSVAIANDAIDEADESINITLANATGANLGTPNSAVITITDDDATPAVTFTSANQSKAENAGTATITAQLSAASGQAVTVPFTVTGTAANPADYTITASPIIIAAGATSANITISIVDDAIYENPNETVIVTMGTPTNAAKGVTTAHTLTITDNDPAPSAGTIALSSATYTVAENGTSATITATRTGGSFGTASVAYATSNGIATAGSDYTVASGTLTWADADTASKTFTIAITNDALDEANETVNITLSSVTGATLGSPAAAVLTITDDDATPTVTFTSASQSKTESAGTATITAQLSAASGQAVTVPFTVTGTATNPGDYTITANPITIAAGATSANITVTIVDDAVYENPNETVIVTMGTPTNAAKGATAIHTLTITDNDLPDIVTSSASLSVPEGTTATFQVKLSAQPAANVTVAIARSAGDSDISVSSGSSLTFTTANWSTYQTVTLACAEDADTANGSSTVSCTSGTANTKNVTASEADNDYNLTVNNDGNGTTSPSGATVKTKGSAVAVSATASSNYLFTNWTVTAGSATFANANSAETTVTASADATVRANFAHQTATLTMAAVGNGTCTPASGSSTAVNTATAIPITAAATAGNTFVGWNVTGNAVVADSESASTTVTLSGNSTVTANFISGIVTTITADNPETLLSGAKYSKKMFRIVVPAGKTSLNIVTSGGSGDCDIYAKFGSAPTLLSYLKKATNHGIGDTLSILNPSPGAWYIMLYGYSAYSNYTLLVTLGAGGPAQVANLKATSGNTDSIPLTWDVVPGADSYEVYRSDVDNVELATKISDVSAPAAACKDAFSTAGKYKYYYWVRAANANGKGEFSDTASGMTADTAVTVLKNGTAVLPLISGNTGSIKTCALTVPADQTLLEIKVSGGKGDCDFDVVKSGAVLRKAMRGSNVELVQIENPDAGVWLIRLYGVTDYSGLSLMAKYSRATALPAAPAVTATDGTYEDRVVVTWKAVASATRYEIFRNTLSSSITGSDLKSLGETSDCIFEDCTALSGTKYYYFAKARNSYYDAKTKSASTGISKPGAVNLGYVANAPSVPGAVTASDGTYFDKVRISWTKVAGATSYLVFRTESAVAPNPSNVEPLAETTALFLDDFSDDFGDGFIPAPGVAVKKYFYWIAAKNETGTTAISRSNDGYLSRKGPAKVTASNGTYSDRIIVTWTAVPGATAYDVFRYTDTKFANGEKLLGAGIASLECVDTPAETDKVYYYRVRAKYGSGDPAVYKYDSDFSLGAAPGNASSKIMDAAVEADLNAGDTLSNISNTKGSSLYYSVSVPAGTTRLVATLEGTANTAANDCDLFAKFANLPTKSSYGGKGIENEDMEILTVSNPAAGTWYFLLYGATGYDNVSLTVNCYSACDIVLTQVPANDLPAPFKTVMKGQVVDNDKKGIPNIVLQARNPITGLTSLLKKTDAKGFFSYSTTISTEGEHTFDFFFNDIPDSAKGTASHTVATRKGFLEENNFFDQSAYLQAAALPLVQDDLVGLQNFLNTRNGWNSKAIAPAYEEMWIDKTLASAPDDAKLAEKLEEGLYMFFYGVEGVAVGNDTAADSAIRAVPFVIHVEPAKMESILSRLNTLGIVDDTQMAAILAGKTGVVTVASISRADGGDDISLMACEQLSVLVNLAKGSVTLLEDRKYSDTLAKMLMIDTGSKQLNVITACFVK